MPYDNDLADSLWAYRRSAFPKQDELFDRNERDGNRPPVFLREHSIHNVLLAPDLTAEQVTAVRSAIPIAGRHRWFRSMKSSQALAQSVFGNLDVLGLRSCLDKVEAESGEFPFGVESSGGTKVCLEHQVNHLGEDPRRCTSVDVKISIRSRVFIECKLAEKGVVTCSRPDLSADDPDFCNGNHEIQQNRTVRCSLTARGIAYWRYVPQLFRWPDIDHKPCPLHSNYQIIRNLLAACVTNAGEIDTTGVRVVLLVDRRNPAFQEGGSGRNAYNQVREALFKPELLQWCTWQDVLVAMACTGSVQVKTLAENVRQKYGL